jgi:hypothetical protein
VERTIIAKEEIASRWVKKTGDWDGFSYKNIQYTITTYKTIGMQIERRIGEEDIIRFIGGPTGHESYYVNSLLAGLNRKIRKELFICAGTINSWPQCSVPFHLVIEFIQKHSKD